MTTKSIFKFSDVASKNANPASIREAIKHVLEADDDACSSEIEPYLMAPGLTGSREWDHAYAVRAILKHDARHGGRISSIMIASHIKERALWDWVVRVYVSSGFHFAGGRLVGLLEDKSSETNGNASVDSVE